MMGIFSTFCGLIYNDFLSIPIPISNSCYVLNNDEYIRLNNCEYPIGMDHTWHHSKNSISFINSFKMKFSIVIGVIHMLIGITMKGLNCIYF